MGSNVSIGANVQYNNDADPPNITITPKNSLSADTVYAISYPSGAFTQSGAGGSFVGAGYTFDTISLQNQLYAWPEFVDGANGNNNPAGQDSDFSSPVQVAGGKYFDSASQTRKMGIGVINGTMWTWGNQDYGGLGLNDTTKRSSPTQIPGTTWSKGSILYADGPYVFATRTDGTLWAWGENNNGQCGTNNTTDYSSPTQIPGTTWNEVNGGYSPLATKTDGTLWSWGYGYFGTLGLNQGGPIKVSSPVQIPGTDWSSGERKNTQSTGNSFAIRTDGTLWGWGVADRGQLGNNTAAGHKSSPTQIPGTTWSLVCNNDTHTQAIKTDGTLWVWGQNNQGQLGQNNTTLRSSPTQIPGTTWSDIITGPEHSMAIKTDGTVWTWGQNSIGQLGLNNITQYSSPVQVPGTNWSFDNINVQMRNASFGVFKQV
tara:strand:+ start:1 stop:1284 length:1284 start_codon:yes stop_codon:yes gene_type:complete